MSTRAPDVTTLPAGAPAPHGLEPVTQPHASLSLTSPPGKVRAKCSSCGIAVLYDASAFPSAPAPVDHAAASALEPGDDAPHGLEPVRSGGPMCRNCGVRKLRLS